MHPATPPQPPIRALLLFFALVAAALSAFVPLGESADEVSHYAYVRYVAEHGGLPPVVPGTSVLGETFQPPLYYALAAPLTAWLPRGDPANLGLTLPIENNPDWELGNPQRARVQLQPAAARWPWRGEALGWHGVRVLSVLLGVVTLYATYRLGRLLFPNEPWTAWLGAALVAFLPSFAALSAAATNDALTTMLAALLLWQGARLVTGASAGGRGWALAGLLGALGVWTKASGWLFVGTLVLAALLARGVAGRRPKVKGEESAGWQPLRGRLGNLGWAGGAWLVGVLPLWAINAARAGDPLGRGVQAQVTEARASLTLGALGETALGLYRTWWAAYGGAVHLSFPAWLNGLLVLPLALAGWGLLRRHGARGAAAEATQRLLPWLAAHIALVGAAWLLWTSLVMGTGQARLLFPALPAIALLLAGGLSALAPRGAWGGRAPALAGAAGMAALLALSVGGVAWPAWRSAPPALAAPPAATAGPWAVGTLPLALSAFHFPLTIDDRPPPGSESALYLAWQSRGPLPDVRLRLRWLDGEGREVASRESSPLAGHPLADEWLPGEYRARHRVAIPPTAAAGYHRLLLSLVDPATDLTYPLALDGQPLGDEIMVGQTTVQK